MRIFTSLASRAELMRFYMRLERQSIGTSGSIPLLLISVTILREMKITMSM